MIVDVKRNRELKLKNAQNTQNENRAETITLVVPEEYEDYNKKIVFITPNGNVWDIITNNEYKITNAITKYKEVEFYIWLTKEVDGETIDFRTKTKPLNFFYNEDASDEITPEQINGVTTVINLLEEEIDKVENLDLDITKIGNTATVTLTKKDGTTKEVEINDGQDGYTPQKGTDYFTQEDIQEIENDVKNDLQETVLVDYSLITETGSKIELSINTTNYKLTAILKDKNNATICTSNEIDLPLETMVVDATYDNTTKEIVLTLQNGTTVEFSVADLVSGLVSESQLQTILANYYTQTEINNLLANKVDKVAGKGLSTNDFTDEYKEQVDTNTEDIEDIQEEQTEQNTSIQKLQTENTRLKATLPTTTGSGETITLDKTAELEFKKPPLPMGNSEQVQYSGKNLLNKELFVSTNLGNWEVEQIENGIRVTHKNNYSTGVPTVTVQLKPNTTYTYSQKQMTGFSIIEDGGSIKYPSTGKATLTTGNLGTITITIVVAENTTAEFTYMQLEEGSTATDYEPYVGGTASPNPDYPQEITNVTGDVEVVVENKNIINITNEVNVTNQGVVITGDEDKQVIKFKGTISNTYCQSGILPLKKPISTGIFRANFKSTCDAFIVLVGENTTWLKNMQSSVSSSIVVDISTLSEPVVALKFGIEHFTSGANVDYEVGYQLTKGSELSSYVSHQHQTFIFPLGNEKLMLGDYLADDGIHHVRGQMTFDGTENWQNYVTVSGDIIQAMLSITGFNSRTALCDSLKVTTDYSATEHLVIGSTLLSLYIHLDKTRLNTEDITGFKNWLSTHNIVLEYELAEETITPYTSAQQTVYNAIKNAISYEEQTNISGSSNGSNPKFSVKAYQNTRLVLESFENRLTLIEG